MAVLRENRDSLVATLEAFVHDPLISWRLLNNNNKKDKEKDKEKEKSDARPNNNNNDNNNNNNNINTNNNTNRERSTATIDRTTMTTISNAGKYQHHQSDSSTDMYVIDDTTTTTDATTTNTAPIITTTSSSSETTTAHTSTHPPPPPTITPGSSSRRVRSSSKGMLMATGPATRVLDPIIEALEPIDEAHGIVSTYGDAIIDKEGATTSSADGSVASGLHIHVAYHSRHAGGEDTSSVRMSSTPSQLTAVLIEASTHTSHNESTTTNANTTTITEPSRIPINNTTTSTTTKHTAPTTSRISTDSPRYGSSLKTVSFAPVNQTLQADNRILNSSPRLEIFAHPPPSSSIIIQSTIQNNTITTTLQPMIADDSFLLRNGGDVEATSTDMIHTSNTNSNDNKESRLLDGLHVPLSSSVIIPHASFRANLHVEMSSLANSAHILTAGPVTGDGNDPDTVAAATAINDSFAYSLVQSRLSISMSRHSLHSVMTHSSNKGKSKSSVINHTKIEDANLDPYAETVDETATGVEDLNDLQQELIEKAVVVIRRVMDKLNGLDFKDAALRSSSNSSGSSTTTDRSSRPPQLQALQVPEQVDLLIKEAASNENLSQSFFGWCPFW